MRVLQYPADRELLRRVARPVREDEFGTDRFIEWCSLLGSTMLDARGAGLASTQVAETPFEDGQAVAAFALAVNATSYGIVCNPEIVDAGEKRPGREGCLSFASVPEILSAPDMVVLVGKNPQGKEFQTMLSGEAARAAYHEVEHLRGKLIVDRMSNLKRTTFLRAVEQRRRKMMAAAQHQGVLQ